MNGSPIITDPAAPAVDSAAQEGAEVAAGQSRVDALMAKLAPMLEGHPPEDALTALLSMFESGAKTWTRVDGPGVAAAICRRLADELDEVQRIRNLLVAPAANTKPV